MILTQVEACLSSRPLTPLPQLEDGIEVLTPGYFLIGHRLEGLPDLDETYEPISSLLRWYLCQVATHHLWQRWSQEYLTNLQQFAKWSHSSPNIKVGDIMCVKGEVHGVSQPTKWSLAQIEHIHPGLDGNIHAITLRTSKGTYSTHAQLSRLSHWSHKGDDSRRDHTEKAVRLWLTVCSSMNCLIVCSHMSNHMIRLSSTYH